VTHGLIAAIGIAIGGFGALASVQAPAPSDFALRIQAEPCSGDEIDTETATYRRTIRRGEVQTAQVFLTDAQRADLHGLVTEAEFFSYPQKFSPEFEGGFSSPASHFVISIRSAGQYHTVEWTILGVTTPEARRLRRFLAEVYAYFRALPEVQALPRSQVVCM